MTHIKSDIGRHFRHLVLQSPEVADFKFRVGKVMWLGKIIGLRHSHSREARQWFRAWGSRLLGFLPEP